MQDIRILSEELDKDNASSYILSIRYQTDGLYFCVVDKNFTPLAIVKKTLNTGAISDPLLHLKYNKTILLVECKDKLLSPPSLFEKDDSLQIYNMITESPKSGQTVIHNKLSNPELYITSTTDTELINLYGKGKNTIVMNTVAPFLHWIFSFKQPDIIGVDIHEQYVDIVIKWGSHLMLFNSFNYKSPTDILYYILATLQTSKIDISEISVLLTGYPDAILNELEKLLHPYAALIEIPSDESISTFAKDEVSPIFINNLNACKCE